MWNATPDEAATTFSWLPTIMESFGIFVAAFLAFMFGNWQNWISEKSRREKLSSEKLNDRYSRARIAYHHVVNTIEALALHKMQTVQDVVKSARIIEALDQTHFEGYVRKLEKVDHFFYEIEAIKYELSRVLSDAEFVSNSDQFFPKTAFHVEIATGALYDFICRRNHLIPEYARVASTNGLTPYTANYFIPLLIQLTDGISTKLDESLFFLMCLSKQLERYIETDNSRNDTPRFVASPELTKLIPDMKYIPQYSALVGIEY